MADKRRELGLTCEALDAHAGFSDRYVTKLEHPAALQGRTALRVSAMCQVWLDACGVVLVVMDKGQAEELGVA